MIIRFEFKTRDCKFRKYKTGSIAINDKRTKACKQYKAFCEQIKNDHKGYWKSCWSEKATERSCVLALEI